MYTVDIKLDFTRRTVLCNGIIEPEKGCYHGPSDRITACDLVEHPFHNAVDSMYNSTIPRCCSNLR